MTARRNLNSPQTNRGTIKHRADSAGGGRKFAKPTVDPEFTAHELQMLLVPIVFLPRVIILANEIKGFNVRLIRSLHMDAPVPIDLEERVLEFGSAYLQGLKGYKP